jgi:CHAT domain
VPDAMNDRRGQFLDNVVTKITDLRNATCDTVMQVDLTRVDPGTNADYPSGCTIQSPTEEQRRASSALVAEYVDLVLLVLTFLKRYQPFAAEHFERLVHDLISYMRFQRVYNNVDLPDEPWRAQFVHECDSVVNRQVNLLRESWQAFNVLRTRPAIQLGIFRLSSFIDGDGRIGIHAASDLGVAVADGVTLISEAEVERFNRTHVLQRWSGTPTQEHLAALTSFGSKLMASIVAGDLLRLYKSTLDECKSGMRVILDWSETPELGMYPWELMYDGSDFLALSNKTPIVRTLGLSAVSRTTAWTAPIRILVSVSSPLGDETLDPMAERNRLTEALLPLVRMGVVEIDFTPDGTIAALGRMLRIGEMNGNGYHVWHHIGHGRSEAGRSAGGLVFEDASGYGVLVGGFEVSTLLNNHSTLRLVVLNCCHSGQTGSASAQVGMASALARRGVRTVVAMQFEISDDLAQVFAEEFYLALVDGHQVEIAVTEGRRAMFLERSYSEWATPIVIGEGDVGFSTRDDPERS